MVELQFRKTECSFLDTALREYQNMEQTMELRIPDGMPDIGRVLCAWGQTVLRGKEWQEDRISISAGMMVWVLYVSEEDGSARCVDGWIPFQFRWDLPDGVPEGSIRVSLLNRFTDARSISARKLMIRAGIAAVAEAWHEAVRSVSMPEEKPAELQLLQSRYWMRLPREAGEKQFRLEDTLVLPASAPQLRRLLYYRMIPSVTDQKVLADKAVFRGCGNLHLLYESEGGQLHSWDFELPFSQYSELKSSYSTDAQTQVIPCVTGLELEGDDEGHLHLKCSLVGQYIVEDNSFVEVLEDAYCPGREIEPEREVLMLPTVLDSSRIMLRLEKEMPADAGMIIDAVLLPDHPRKNLAGEMGLCASAQLLYYGTDGSLQAVSHTAEAVLNIPADSTARLFTLPQETVQLQTAVGSGTASVRCEIPVQITAVAGQGLSVVTGLKMGQKRAADPLRPSLVVCRAGKRRLWDIARDNGSTVDAILSVNGLQEEPEADRLLLIPVM